MLRVLEVWLLMFLISLAGVAVAECPKGDLSGDCRVDFLDVRALASQWLYPSSWPGDLDGLNGVEARDWAILADNWLQVGIPLVINEVLASNSHTNADPQGQFDDWIEIYNAGGYPIDTGGMHLTDELGNPTKWQIPTGIPGTTTIQPGGYLLVWADTDVTAPSGLHANFELNADSGDEVGLYDCNGVYIDSIEFPDQTPDISYGRFPDGNDTIRFLAFPTAKDENLGAYAGQVADTKFSHNRGFYYSPFSVTIATETDGASIYYTLDGSSPMNLQTGAPTGTLFTGGIPITTTSCLRAVALKNGWKPTNIDAQTYIFPNDVLKQATNQSTGAQVVPSGFPMKWDNSEGSVVTGDYQIDPDIVGNVSSTNRLTASDLLVAPTVSLVFRRGDLFDLTGIYLNEELTYRVPEATERAVSVEYIDPASGESVQANCAIAMAGGASGGGTSLDRWKSYKLSMRPRFKSTLDNGTYTGGPSKLNFKVFADSPVERFDSIVLDAVLNHSWLHSDSSQRNTVVYIQDQYISDMHNAMGGYSPHGIHGYLYLNGLHWGMYYFHERPDHSWAAEMFGGDRDEYDAIKHGSYTVNDSLGGDAFDSYNNMLSAASAVQSNPTNPTKYATLCQLLDVDNLITYLIVNWYAGNTDWPHKNWYATCRNHPDGRWRYHSWDAEHGMDKTINASDINNKVGESPSDIHDRLKGNADYLLRWADILHKNFHNDGAMTPPNLADLYRERMATADRAILAESARWGDNRQSSPHTRSQWLSVQQGKLDDFFPQRSYDIFNRMKGMGLYPNIAAPEFRVNGSYRHGGYISSSDSFSIMGGVTLYYTTDGSDPRVPVSVDPGVTITIVQEDAYKRVLVPTADIGEDWKSDGGFDDSTWTSVTGGPGGIGYERNSGYDPYFTLDVEDEMYAKQDSCYIRIPFQFRGDLSAFDRMTIKVRYDDGFIAYLNGAENELTRRNFNDPVLEWDSSATSSHSDSVAVQFEHIDISQHLDKIQLGPNILAIQALNYYGSGPSSDFLISVELEIGSGGGASGGDLSDSAVEYSGPMTFDKSTQVRSRVKSGDTWSAINEATYGIGPVAESLRISEIMYHPQETGDPNDPNAEFVELTNIGAETINLNLVSFTNGIDFTFGDTPLAPGEYVLIVRDANAFASHNPGLSGIIAGEYNGALDNQGERIELQDALGQTILNFRYEDGWRSITDGLGYSLTIIDQTDSEPNTQDSWRASAYPGGSPGADDSGIIPNPGDVVINEILAHSHAEAPDWIELHNTTDALIDISGWYLSDSPFILQKYQFEEGTTIGAYDYLVLYQDANFGETSIDPGRIVGFAFSENGDEAYLSSAEEGALTGYRAVESFGASYTGISFGRYYKTSTGNYNFVPMESNTPKQPNSYPAVGPIVISEIMYNPDWPVGGAYGNDRYEYVELMNITGQPVRLWREDKALPWKFKSGIDYVFPDWPDDVTIPAGDRIVVVRDVNAFTERYPAVPSEKIFGPYEGQLADGGEQIELEMPGDIDKFGRQHYIRIDRVTYSDGSHHEDVPGGIDLWPTEPDGGGDSLNRITPELYGNDPNNWTNASPSPGN